MQQQNRPSKSGAGSFLRSLRPRFRIKTRFFLSIALMSILFIALFGLAYSAYYDKFVTTRRQQQLQRAFTQLETGYNGVVADSQQRLERIELTYGFRMMIISSQSNLIKYNSLFYQQRQRFNSPIILLENVITMAFGSGQIETILDSAEPPYRLFRVREQETGVEYYGLFGQHSSGDYILLQLPTPLIESTNEFTTLFLLLAGMAALTITMALSYVMARHFTNPIVIINRIAERMADLDFTYHYSGPEVDEIGTLGSSINKLSEHLEETISELKISNARLEQEIIKARELDELRKELLVNVSHELKTPIALIQGYAEGLRINLNSDEEGREFYCSVIEEEARHMNRLVLDLLSVSRIEAGATQIEPEEFPLDELVGEAVTRMAPAGEPRNLEIVFNPAHAVVTADRDMMEQVVVNYLTNALDHTPDGGSIRVYCEPGERHVRLCVRNSGEGIDERELPRIWRSFYKLDKARTRSIGGTGIGLSIVKAVMEAHHCDYGAHNIEGGVVFWCDIPLASPAQPGVEGLLNPVADLPFAEPGLPARCAGLAGRDPSPPQMDGIDDPDRGKC